MKCLAQVPYRKGARLLPSLRLSGLIGSSFRVSAGEVFCSCSGVVAVEIVIPAGEVLCSCSGAWYHVGAFIPL